MLTQQQINSILKYIIFFVSVYVFTCFFDSKSVYFYLFIIFILALFFKLAFYSSTRTLVRLSWGFLGICLLSIFSGKIVSDNFGEISNEGKDNSLSFSVFKIIITFLSSLGEIIKSIFIESCFTYMLLFMVLGTLYGSMISKGNPNTGIIGWIVGLSIGFGIWLFLSI